MQRKRPSNDKNKPKVATVRTRASADKKKKPGGITVRKRASQAALPEMEEPTPTQSTITMLPQAPKPEKKKAPQMPPPAPKKRLPAAPSSDDAEPTQMCQVGAQTSETKLEQQNPMSKEKNQNTSDITAKWLQRALDMGVDNLRQEYRGLAQYVQPNMDITVCKENPTRNRYQDVPCQEANRVILKYPGAATSYIHANYVGTPQNEKRFICTQGPLDNTVNEFWQMVLQEQSETIIMLCNTIEMGKIKCAEYFPPKPGDVKRLEGAEIAITNKGQQALPDEPSVVLSIFEVKSVLPTGIEVKEVRHYHWQNWPDRGVPPCRLTSLSLLSFVRGNKKPIVVHCSAGIGRTGTIVAIEFILQRLVAGKECSFMGELLKELRNNRAFSIQNDLQYLYIHRIIMCYFLEKYRQRYETMMNAENTAKYKKFVEDYNAVTGT